MRTVIVMSFACALAACAAGGAGPATAAPRKKPASKVAPAPRPHAPLAIGHATVDRVKKSWEVAGGGYGRAVAVSRALGRVAFANKDGVELFDLITGKSTGKVQRWRDGVRGGDPEGRRWDRGGGGPMLRGAGAAVFVRDVWVRDSPATFLLVALGDGALAAWTLWALLRTRRHTDG